MERFLNWASDLSPNWKTHPPRSRPVQCPDYMKKGAFPRAGSPDKSDGLTGRHLQVDPFQHLDPPGLCAEGFIKVAHLQKAIHIL